MTDTKAPTPIRQAEPHDPYRMRTLEQILTLFDGGDFITELMEKHKDLQVELIEHNNAHGSKGCSGTMTITVAYKLGKSGDVAMDAAASFKGPKKPPSTAAAFINDDGELTLYSPFMARMHQPPRDVADVTPAGEYDAETGEIIDVE